MLYKYLDIYFVEGDKGLDTDLVTHRIITPDNQPPINTRQYRLAEQQKSEIDKRVGDLNLITKGNSWPLPLFFRYS